LLSYTEATPPVIRNDAALTSGATVETLFRLHSTPIGVAVQPRHSRRLLSSPHEVPILRIDQPALSVDQECFMVL
jgi:hypothetical protein